jgi:hypothetical protein
MHRSFILADRAVCSRNVPRRSSHPRQCHPSSRHRPTADLLRLELRHGAAICGTKRFASYFGAREFDAKRQGLQRRDLQAARRGVLKQLQRLLPKRQWLRCRGNSFWARLAAYQNYYPYRVVKSLTWIKCDFEPRGSAVRIVAFSIAM